MPFGLDLKSMIVGALLIWAIPFILGFINRPNQRAAA